MAIKGRQETSQGRPARDLVRVTFSDRIRSEDKIREKLNMKRIHEDSENIERSGSNI
jgi:hypothetical protein